MIAIHNPRLYLFLCAILLPSLLFSQTTIRGKILDAASKDPIPFVNIGIKALANGTVSDENGVYQLSLLKASPQQIVTISAIGYESKTIPMEELKKSPIFTFKPEVIPFRVSNFQQKNGRASR